MSALTNGNREALRDRIREAALPLLLQRPLSDTTIRNISDAVGASYWSVYRQYETREELYRDTVLFLFEKVAAELARPARDEPSVVAAVSSLVGHMSVTMQRAPYRNLLFLIMRDAGLFPWLETVYRERIIEPLGRMLEGSIRRAGARHGVIVGVQPGAATRAIRALETLVVVPTLLPSYETASPAELERSRQLIVNQLVDRTFTLSFDASAA